MKCDLEFDIWKKRTNFKFNFWRFCQKDIIQCCAVNVPWSAGIQKEILKDIAVMTGATLVDNEFGLKIEDVKLEHFGSAKTIRVD